MSQNTTEFFRCCYIKLTTCFGPCCGPSSGHKNIYSWKLYSVSHKIYQSKKLNKISLLFNILMLFMTRLRSGYITKLTI